jgi:hypothetical protein
MDLSASKMISHHHHIVIKKPSAAQLAIMKFWKLGWGQKEPVHFTPTASERFPIEAAEAFEPIGEVIRNVDRTGSPPGTLLCSFPDPAPGTSLNQFRFQLYREN